MNNHWKISPKKEHQSENDFSRKVGYHTQIGGESQPDNSEIIWLNGFRKR